MSKHKHEQEQQSEIRKQENLQDQNAQNAPSAQESTMEHGADKQQLNQSTSDLESQLAAANEEIARLKAQLDELNDKYLRILAEQVNFRKRVVKEKEEFQQYAVSMLLNDLIPVLDDLIDLWMQLRRIITMSKKSSKVFALFRKGSMILCPRNMVSSNIRPKGPSLIRICTKRCSPRKVMCTNQGLPRSLCPDISCTIELFEQLR